MIIRIFILLMTCLIVEGVNAQDVIHPRKGKSFEAKVIFVYTNYIEFEKPGNIRNSVFQLDKSEILKVFYNQTIEIEYGNGSNEKISKLESDLKLHHVELKNPKEIILVNGTKLMVNIILEEKNEISFKRIGFSKLPIHIISMNIVDSINSLELDNIGSNDFISIEAIPKSMIKTNFENNANNESADFDNKEIAFSKSTGLLYVGISIAKDVENSFGFGFEKAITNYLGISAGMSFVKSKYSYSYKSEQSTIPVIGAAISYHSAFRKRRKYIDIVPGLAVEYVIPELEYEKQLYFGAGLEMRLYFSKLIGVSIGVAYPFVENANLTTGLALIIRP